MLGKNFAANGTGLQGEATGSGNTVAIYGSVTSTSGVAGLFNHIGGGTILRGLNNGAEKFSVDGNGNVRAAAYLDLAGNPLASGGTITGVTAGTGLTGGGTSGSVSLAVDSTVARTNANNNFSTSQNVTGDLTATGFISAAGLGSDGPNGGVLGRDTIADSAFRIGVQGFAASTGGTGVFGRATATTGLTSGVNGRADSDNGAGVFGRASAATGFTAGVRGVASSPSGNGVRGDMMAPTVGAVMTGGNGVLGSYGLNQDFTTNANATGGIGVIGLNFAPSGTGLQGEANGTGATIGVYAKASSSTGTAAVVNNTGGGTILRGQNNGTEKFRVDGSGDVIINGGDLSAIVQGKGVILRATDGSNCFRITVNNAGALATTLVTCPN
jgi:hypothetical protein